MKIEITPGEGQFIIKAGWTQNEMVELYVAEEYAEARAWIEDRLGYTRPSEEPVADEPETEEQAEGPDNEDPSEGPTVEDITAAAAREVAEVTPSTGE